MALAYHWAFASVPSSYLPFAGVRHCESGDKLDQSKRDSTYHRFPHDHGSMII